MRLAYVDTSCLVAIAFGEPGSRELAFVTLDRRQRDLADALALTDA